MKTATLWKAAAIGAGVFWGIQGWLWLRAMRRLPAIDPADAHPDDGAGRLAAIVPARNEEAALEAGLGSLLAHVPQRATVVAIDDRSIDRTGEILTGLAATDGRLRVISVSTLPPGYLGKTHALMVGSEAARGDWGGFAHDDWLLFTDADVIFAEGGIQAAWGYARSAGLDHFVLFPKLDYHGFWEAAFVSAFSFLFGVRFQLWDVNDPASDAYMGVGAFNLVRAEAYDRAGGHEDLALDVADDVHLGRNLRRSGARQQVAFGPKVLRVRWQHGLMGLIEGLEKNGFAGVDYSLPRLAAATLGMALISSPFLAVFVTRGWVRWANLGSLGMVAAIYRQGHRDGGPPTPFAVTFPLGTALFAYSLWRSAFLALRRGGIEWRGTVHPLGEVAGRRR